MAITKTQRSKRLFLGEKYDLKDIHSPYWDGCTYLQLDASSSALVHRTDGRVLIYACGDSKEKRTLIPPKWLQTILPALPSWKNPPRI